MRWPLLVALVVSAVATVPVVGNYFLNDDFLNFFHVRNDDLLHFLFKLHAGHSVVVRNLIWWALDRLVGTRAEVYFATAVLTHLVTVALWFAAVRRLTGSARAACVAALLWGSAPVQEESLGWYAVYGQVLVAAILAWIVYRVARIADGAPVTSATAAGWVLLVLVAVTSFGIGLGIALALPVAAWLVCPPGRDRTRAVLVLGAAAVLGPVVYQGLVAFHVRLFGMDAVTAVVHAGLDYPVALLRMLVALLAHGVGALVGATVASRVDGTQPLLGAVGVVLLLAFAWAPGRARRLMLAGLVLALGCYAPIAAGRVVFWKEGIRYDTYARFQYAATLPLSLVLAVVLSQMGEWVRVPEKAKDAATFALACLVLACQLWLRPPFDHHAATRRETEEVIVAIRAAVDAAPPGAEVYIENRKFASVGWVMRHVLTEFPGWAGVFVIYFPDNVVAGRRVRFVTTPEVVTAHRTGRRTADLLVTPKSESGGLPFAGDGALEPRDARVERFQALGIAPGPRLLPEPGEPVPLLGSALLEQGCAVHLELDDAPRCPGPCRTGRRVGPPEGDHGIRPIATRHHLEGLGSTRRATRRIGSRATGFYAPSRREERGYARRASAGAHVR